MKNVRQLIRPFITEHGQPYVHEPVGQREVDAPIRPVAAAVASAFGGAIQPRQRVTVKAWKRIPLRWMKPDGNGGLIPK